MKTKEKTMVQYCIDAQTFDEAIKAVPKTITIDSIAFRVGNPMKKMKKRNVPNALRKLGITNARETLPSTEYRGRISDVSRSKLVKIAKEVALRADEEYQFIRVTNLNLSFGDAIAIFTLTTKSIHPDETDQRKKLKVLGLTSSEGNIASLIKELSAKKYSCTFQRVFTNAIICSEMK